jgi:hypothetical protein
MSSTSGTPYYTSRSMNGINQISVINENITDLENKTQDITYNDLTDTTTIVNNTQFYNTTINNSLTASNILATNSLTASNIHATNLRLKDNAIDMSNNGTYTFIDDGVSAEVVDTVHNQTIGGAKTFTGSVDIDTLVINSTTYPDGSTQTSANYLTPIRVDATDRITAINSMETDQLTAVDIYCDTINITGSILDNNETGSAPKSFIYNSTTMCHKDAFVNNTPLSPAVGNYIKSNGIGLIPTGDNGRTVATINTTNRSMTFSVGLGFSLTIPPATTTYTYCAITATNQFTSYETLSGLTNFGIRGASTTSNQPFVNSIAGLYNATTPTTSLTYAPTTTKRGYINANNRLISLDTYTTQPFISMTGLLNPAYVSATFATNEFTVLSRVAITPNTITGTFLAVPLSNTSLTYPTFAGATTDFITQLNNINAGTKPSVNATSTGVLTLSLTHTAPTPASTTHSGYVSANTLKLENTAIPLNMYVVGTGTAVNGIASNINSFISAIPTAPSNTYTIRLGTGTLAPTNTTATSGIIGYVRFLSSKYWFISNAAQTNNNFVEGTGIPDATRMITATSPYVGQTKIMELTQVAGNNPTNSTPAFTALGYVSSTTQVRITSNPALTSSFLFENGTTFNSLIPIGTQISSYNGTTQEIASTGLTATTATTSFFGYMESTTSLQLRGLGTVTQRQNTFFTGTGAPSSRNYISVAATSTPLTFPQTGIASIGTTIPGYTKNASGTNITLITSSANKTPFNTATYFITGGSLGTLITRAAVTQGFSSSFQDDIQISSDGENFGSVNTTTQEPAPAAVYLKAYAISTTKYYVLQSITTLTASTNYIEALDAADDFTFTFGLTLLGTFSANGYDTTGIIQSSKLQSLDSAIYDAGGGIYYYCDKYTDNSADRFLVNATLAPASSVVCNSTIFDKGSGSISQLLYKVAPTASTFVSNCNATISYFILSTAVVSGKQNTVIHFKTNTRATLITFDQFFINGGFANSGLNGGHIISKTLNSTGLAGTFTLQHNTAVTPTAAAFEENNITGLSSTVFDMFFIAPYVPAVGHFFYAIENTTPNYITAVLPITGFTGNYRITLAYAILYKPNDNYYFYIPINNNSSLLNTSIFDTYESSRFKVFQSGQTFTYYPRINYSAFTPITVNFYNQTNSSITPIQYTIKTPLTYNYITPLIITDYGRTTLSFHATETITFYTFYNINLPPNQANTTLVSIDAIQTLTNKTLDRIGLNSITNQTSTQLGYRISNILSGTTSGTSNTWNQPTGSTGQITLVSQGVYLLSYSFTVKTSNNMVLMGALTLLNNLNTVYMNPQTTNVPASVFAFCGQANGSGNYNTCANSYVYINTTANTIIYLWMAASSTSQLLQSQGGYFQAVRIA